MTRRAREALRKYARARRDRAVLGAVLRRYLTTPDEVGNRPFFFIRDDRLILDGDVEISRREARVMLRATKGQIDGPGFRWADPQEYE